MDVEVVRELTIVKSVSGDVIAVKVDGSARKLSAGDAIGSNEIVITGDQAHLQLETPHTEIDLEGNCVGCIDEHFSWAAEPLAGEVQFNLELPTSPVFDEDEFAEIQNAILGGEDPTAILEATAAGAGAGSANAGFVTIEYNGTQVQASTFFETTGLIRNEEVNVIDELRPFISAAGGQSIQETLTEGSLSQSGYPQSIVSSILIQAGDLALDPESFSLTSTSISALLNELNSDITSGGQSVSFTYDVTEQVIVGVQGGEEVLRIDMDVINTGKDATLTLTTTISQPLDHLPSIAGGQVSLVNDQITISFDIEGKDSGGNPIQKPISAQVNIVDGVNASPQTVNFENVESNTTLTQGTFALIGSDTLESVTFNESALSQFNGLLSDNQATTAVLSEGGSRITLVITETGETVLTAKINVDGSYQFQQLKPLENIDSDSITLLLPTTSTDFDQDSVSNTISIVLVDGQNPVITNVDSITVEESGVVGGSEEGTAQVSGTGTISATAGSDIIDHFELAPGEFNTNRSLTSNGQAVSLELISEVNGVRTYEGFVEVNGSRITVFDVKLDTPTLGEYQFTLFEPLHHVGDEEADLTFNLPVYAIDADGDASSIAGGTGSEQAAAIKVTVVDDVVKLVGNSFSFVEPTTAGDESVSYNLFDPAEGGYEGADGASITSFTYSGNTYSLNPDAAPDSLQTFNFDEGTLSISLSGAFTFEVARDIDHSKAETISEQFVFTAKDADGDSDTATVNLSIKDGDNLEIKVIPSVRLEESTLSDGSSPNTALLSSTQVITLVDGSDDLGQFRIDVNAFNTNVELKSDGFVVQLKEDPTGSGHYVGFTKDASDNVTEIFTLTFDPINKAQYTFTLIEALDHTPVQGANNLSFDLNVIATDTDGDDSEMKHLKVTIVDDIPEIIELEQTSTLAVNEAELGAGTDQATGSFETTTGADGVESYELRDLTDTASDLYSGTEKVSITEVVGAANATTYQGATSSGAVVFTLTLSNDGSYTFTLNGALNHADNSDTLTIPFNVVAVDGDGDNSSVFKLPIEVKDDKPEIIGTSGETTVDEDDLANIGSDQSQDTTIDGKFVIEEGADGVVSYELVDADLVLTGLTSGGESLEWTPASASGNTLTYTVQTVGGNEPVFKIVFDVSDNSYQFQLLKPIQHSNGAGENTVQLDFSIKAEDFDGDKSNAITLPIVITDDVPHLTEQTISRVEGQGFRGSKVDMFANDTDQGADSASLTEITGVNTSDTSIVFNGPRGTYLESVDLRDGSQNIRVYEQTKNAIGETETRQLGVLRVNSNGEIEFKATNYLEHDGDSIDFAINVTATDGDLDTSQAQVNISVTDRESKPIALKVTTFEDAGRDPSINYANGDDPELENAQDNQNGLSDSPAHVALQVNMYDNDNDESIGSLTIKDSNHRGDFYYLKDGEYHQLEADPSTGEIIFDGSLIEQSSSTSGNNTIATIDNLFFVPDRNASTGNGGVRIKYELQIDNNSVADHTVSSSFKIEIESVADIATWDDNRSTYQYQIGEDEGNVRLQLRAESQDASRPETITYELKVTAGEGQFELLDRNGDVITPENGVYTISSSDINRIEVNPIDHFAGEIRFEATAVTTERSNAFDDNGGSNNKSSARSTPQDLVIDVTPEADLGRLSVSRIQINEDNIDDPNYRGNDANHEPFTLNEVITMKGSDDTDNSEVLYARISNITEGAELVWAGGGASQITVVTINGTTYQEVPYEQLKNVEVVPKHHSNEDFTFDVTGVVKDSVELSTGTQVDELELGTKTVHVDVKGVVDVPTGGTEGSHWTDFSDGDIRGLETTILESQDGSHHAVLDFTVLSGERDVNDLSKPDDGSESITVLLSNIPEGVSIEDSDGTKIDLNFVGYQLKADGSFDLSKPIYEANITDSNVLSGIIIRPVDSSTENIHIKGTIIVTENDGHTQTYEQEIRVNVAPVIDTASTYSNRSVGNEDQAIDLDWHPKGEDYSDSDEHFTSVEIKEIPDGVLVQVNGNVDWNYDSDTGTLTVKPLSGQSPAEFTQIALSNDFIQVTPPQDSSADFKLTTEVGIEERDHEYTSDDIVGEGGRVTATITGDISVVVRPIVEPQDDDNKLVVSNEDGSGELTTIAADANGVIKFTTNSNNEDVDSNGVESWVGEHVIRYEETDASSNELIDDVVIQLKDLNGSPISDDVLNQLVVTGAAYEGNGRWVVTDEDAFSISAPNGVVLPPSDNIANYPQDLNGLVMTMHTLVSDQGEDANENSAQVNRQGSVTLTFPEVLAGGSEVAASITVPENSIVSGTEDTQLDLGHQLNSIIQFSGEDTSIDEVTIIIDSTVLIGGGYYPISVAGGDGDFVNGKYVFQSTIEDGKPTSFDGLMLNLPKDFSGDFRLPFTVVTKDTVSGDEKTTSTPSNVIVKVDPIVDAPDPAKESPVSVTVIDEGGHSLSEAYEDSDIYLNFSHTIEDKLNGVEGGNEVLSSITLTLPDIAADGTSLVGAFYDSNGTNLGASLTFNQAEIANGALDKILFKPSHNYPGANGENTVTVSVTGTVTDTATFNEQALLDAGVNSSSIDSKDFSTTVNFDVTPVVDDIQVNGQINSEGFIEVSGLEDEVISLGNSGPVSMSLTDLDGSEQFVSLKFTNVPEGFLLTADSGYTVKNNGSGVWSVQLPPNAGSELDLSAIKVQPPKHFSGTAEFGVAVFTQESLLGVPTQAEGLPNFKLHVSPVGDSVDIDATDTISGSEGHNIDLEINASVIDNSDSATGSGTYTENSPETLRVNVSGVPEGASIYHADGTTLANYDPSTKVWSLDVPTQQLDKIVFNSGELNSGDGNKIGIDSPITVSVQSVDKDADGSEHLGPTTKFNVDLVVDPVNDQPTFVNVSGTNTLNLMTEEDHLVAVNSFTIADIDATYDDPNAIYTLTLQVNKGSLESASHTGVTFSSDPDGNLVMTGKIVDINAALTANKVMFKPDQDSNDMNSGGSVSVTAIVDDGGNNGSIDPNEPNTSPTNQTTFEIQVTEVNDKPEASDINFGPIAEEGQIIISAQDLLSATSDKDGDMVHVVSLDIAEGQGSLVHNTINNTWVFTAADNYNGNVELTYVVKDDGTTNGQADSLSDSAKVRFSVEGVNDAPVISGDNVTDSISEAEHQLIDGIKISDVDYVDEYADDLMTVTLTVDYGHLSVVIPDDANISVRGVGTNSIVIVGTLAEVNELVGSPAQPNGVYLDASFAPNESINLHVVAKDSGNPSGIAIETDPVEYDIQVTPIANAPLLTIDPALNHVRNITASQAASNNGIALVGILATLTDINETLSLEISGLPTEANLVSDNGVVDFANNTWTVSPDDIDSLRIEGAGVNLHTINIVAVSEESNGGIAKSDAIELQLNVVSDSSLFDQSNETDDVQLLGEGGSRELLGGSGNDHIDGGSGHDVLNGGAGDDTLIGGEGNDRLIGGFGSDILTGGTGMDTFVWHEIDDGATDTITDFNLSEGDKIDLREVLPELRTPDVNMTTLLEHIDAKLEGDNVELTIHPDGTGAGEQVIMVEHLAHQLALDSFGSHDIVNALIDQNVMIHDQF